MLIWVLLVLSLEGEYVCFLVFFFFKQKTAYEMRISDWSSDVCSSDLADPLALLTRVEVHASSLQLLMPVRLLAPVRAGLGEGEQIGRASCRERVCQYV